MLIHSHPHLQSRQPEDFLNQVLEYLTYIGKLLQMLLLQEYYPQPLFPLKPSGFLHLKPSALPYSNKDQRNLLPGKLPLLIPMLTPFPYSLLPRSKARQRILRAQSQTLWQPVLSSASPLC